MRVMKEFEVKKILWFFFQPCSTTWMKVLRKKSEGSQGKKIRKLSGMAKTLGKWYFSLFADLSLVDVSQKSSLENRSRIT